MRHGPLDEVLAVARGELLVFEREGVGFGESKQPRLLDHRNARIAATNRLQIQIEFVLELVPDVGNHPNLLALAVDHSPFRDLVGNEDHVHVDALNPIHQPPHEGNRRLLACAKRILVSKPVRLVCNRRLEQLCNAVEDERLVLMFFRCKGLHLA